MATFLAAWREMRDATEINWTAIEAMADMVSLYQPKPKDARAIL